MSAVKLHATYAVPQKAKPVRLRAYRRNRRSADLKVNEKSEAFQMVKRARQTGRIVSHEGKSAREIVDFLMIGG